MATSSIDLMPTVSCRECGADLSVLPPDSGYCPECGSSALHAREQVSAGLKFGDQSQAVAKNEDGVIAFAESAGLRFTRYASLQPDGSVILRLEGFPPQNEEDADLVLELLLTHFADRGRPHVLCGRSDRDADFVIAPNCHRGQRLNVQVVRALTDPQFWSELALKPQGADLRLSVTQAADAVAAAIWHKAGPRGIPPRQRATMILALDATRLPALALPAVWRLVPGRPRLAGKQLGFSSVFMVGPDKVLVQELAESVPNG